MSLFWAFHFCTLHSICFFQAGIWTSVVNLLAQDVVLLAEVWAKFARTFSSASPLIPFFSRIDASLSDPASLPNWYCEQEHRLVTPFDTCAIRIETLSSAIGSLSYTTWSAKDSPSSALSLSHPTDSHLQMWALIFPRRHICLRQMSLLSQNVLASVKFFFGYAILAVIIRIGSLCIVSLSRLFNSFLIHFVWFSSWRELDTLTGACQGKMWQQ